jgi:light-regulated signal transduction histidine kinase (bacteriophytochrome)
VDLTALADEIIASLRQQTPERSVEVIVAPGLHAEGDATLLRSVLENLLGNAWKYSGKIAAARIEFASKSENNQTIFFIKDNGVGFDMKYAPKLFGVFQRLHDTNEYEGLGIGLASAKRIINRHGGEMWADASPGQGATFYFTLPA